MSADWQRLYFWLGLYVFLNLFGAFQGVYIWFPLMVVGYYLGRMTVQEEAGHVG